MKVATKILKKDGFDVLFKIDDEELDFIGYEFETYEPISVEENVDEYYFRLDIDKETKIAEVYRAFSEDYDIGEDVTELFDIDWLVNEVTKIDNETKLDNHAEAYKEHKREASTSNFRQKIKW